MQPAPHGRVIPYENNVFGVLRATRWCRIVPGRHETKHQARGLQDRVDEVRQILHRLFDGGERAMEGIKAALAVRGLRTPAIAEPFEFFESGHRSGAGAAAGHLVTRRRDSSIGHSRESARERVRPEFGSPPRPIGPLGRVGVLPGSDSDGLRWFWH